MLKGRKEELCRQEEQRENNNYNDNGGKHIPSVG